MHPRPLPAMPMMLIYQKIVRMSGSSSQAESAASVSRSVMLQAPWAAQKAFAFNAVLNRHARRRL